MNTAKKQRRILFIADGYMPKITGGTVVLKVLCDELVRRGAAVAVYAPLRLEGEAAHEEVDSVTVYRGRLSSYAKRQFHPVAVLRQKLRQRPIPECVRPFEEDRRFAEPFRYSLLQLIDDFSPDTVISVCFPFYAHLLARWAKKRRSFQWHAYYLDPFYNNAQYHVAKRGLLRRIEFCVLKKAQRLLMPAFIVPDYAARCFAKKLRVANHPFIDERPTLPPPPPGGPLRCLYLGTFYQDIRSPSFMFRFFERVLARRTLTLACVGRKGYFPAGYFEDWARRFGGALTLSDAVPYHAVPALMAEADLLVNIGNTDANQMPSKIVEYVNTGRPILHFYQIDDCPAKRLLEHYLNAFCIDARRDISDNDIRSFSDFLNEFGTKTASKEEILCLFSDFTLRHVAGVFLE